MGKRVSFPILLVAGFVYVQGIRIDPPTLKKSGKFFAEANAPHSIPNDPRCKNNGMFANPNDCSAYYVCRNGESQDRRCPEEFRFDSIRHCTPYKDADCGKQQLRATAEKVSCKEDYGMFVYEEDCHKFIVCVSGVPNVRTCPEGQLYRDNVGCVEGTVCPTSQQSASNVCKKTNELYPVEGDCRKYIKCVNFVGSSRECSMSKAFDPIRKRCSKEQFNKCKNNDLQGIMRAD